MSLALLDKNHRSFHSVIFNIIISNLLELEECIEISLYMETNEIPSFIKSGLIIFGSKYDFSCLWKQIHLQYN